MAKRGGHEPKTVTQKNVGNSKVLNLPPQKVLQA